MIIVLDTNVAVLGVLKPYSKAAKILRLVAVGDVRLAYDLRVLSEYREVLSRPKFGFDPEDVDAFLAQVEEDGLPVAAHPLTLRLPDADDEPFLEVAISARAEAIVTGNKRHFPMGSCAGVKILSPDEFLEALRAEK